MRQIRRLLIPASKARRISDDPAARIPPELLIMILAHVDGPRDLASLCRASKELQHLVEPLLYNALRMATVARISPNHQRKQPIRTIRNSRRLAILVTSLSVSMGPLPFCPGHWEGRSSRSPCDEHDRQFEKVLPLLCALKALNIKCRLCITSRKPWRHSYLLKRTKIRLDIFTIWCYCTARDREFTFLLLSAPLISSVSALGIHLLKPCPVVQELPDANACARLKSALQNPDFLPNIRTLQNDSGWMSSIVMANRPIERMAEVLLLPRTLDIPTMQRYILQSPGRLQAFFSGNPLEWLPFMVQNVNKFQYLTNIGVFSFIEDPDDSTVDQMACLDVLENLRTIHMSRKWGYWPRLLNISPHFLAVFGQRCRAVLCIRISISPGRTPDTPELLWERKTRSDYWQCYALNESRSVQWDILCGKSEF